MAMMSAAWVSLVQVVTVSDRASTGEYNDLSGPAILNFFKDAIDSPWLVWELGHACMHV